MPRLETAHALIVGISRYRHITRLPTVRDAEAIAAALADPELGAYAAENVRLLLEEEATQAALRDGLADLARRSDADSSVFLYFSGHGGHVETGPHAGQF